eukprot:4261913-Amphidinium_carterae.1
MPRTTTVHISKPARIGDMSYFLQIPLGETCCASAASAPRVSDHNCVWVHVSLDLPCNGSLEA